MVTADKNNDGLFKELFRHDGFEKAPAGFADRVMDTLEAEGSMAKESRWSWSGWWLWASIIFAFACLVGVLFFVDFSFMGGIFNGIEIDGSRVTHFVQYIGSGLVSAFEGYSFSSISITIVMAIGALVIADRLLRRKPKMGMNLI